MTEEEIKAMKAARNKYRREWRAKNRDKVRAAQERYWLKRAGLAEGVKGAAYEDAHNRPNGSVATRE